VRALQCLCAQGYPGAAQIAADAARRIPQNISEISPAQEATLAGSKGCYGAALSLNRKRARFGAPVFRYEIPVTKSMT
jgi:hypothetical protein